MPPIIPEKLNKGDEIRIIAPSRSMGLLLSRNTMDIANQRLADMGFKLTFGKHVYEIDDFNSSPIESRAADLHDAFADKNVKGVLSAIGGFNSNQLLGHIDWDLIKNNPKIFCGYSDTTALQNAMFAKTGLVTYSGPSYSNFGQKLYFDYSQEYFEKCLINECGFEVVKSSHWSDDAWYINQDQRQLELDEGYWIINPGQAEGRLLGGNLCTLNLLQGTEYMPDLQNSILFIEDDSESAPVIFDRDLQSLIHQPGFVGVKGFVIGRFQKESNITKDLLEQIIKSKKELSEIPVVANVDFGHTDPKITFPIGGTVLVQALRKDIKLEIVSH